MNHRAVKNPSLTHALYGAYGDMLMRDRHPVGLLFIEIDPALVDVNVHPAKAEVRFRNQSHIHDLVRDAIREGLRKQGSPAAPGNLGLGFADRVREAIAGFGSRDAELKQGHALSVDDRADVTQDSGLNMFQPLSPDRSVFHSAIHNPQSAPFFPLAQVHNSFIIAQSDDGMAIIDQHAAHERVLFEKLRAQFSSGDMPVQHLLIPVHVELGPAQSGLLVEYLPELNNLGLTTEDFGSGHFVVKAVPSLLVGADYKQLLLDILDEVNVHGKSRKMDELRDEILSVMACHPAIKIQGANPDSRRRHLTFMHSVSRHL